MKNEEKTNVMRLLEGRKIPYTGHTYEPDSSLTGEEIAALLGEPAEAVYKTLVTQGKTGRYYVFVIPVAKELDLKKAAQAAREKSVAMIPQKELLPLTGYIHGGCSPIGMKKPFSTFLQADAQQKERIFVSAGKVGFQIEIAPGDLARMVRLEYADLVTE